MGIMAREADHVVGRTTDRMDSRMLYLDSADTAELADLLGTGLFAGVTTNPTILDRAGRSVADLPELYALTREHGGTFFAQATGADADELRSASDAILEISGDIVVKLPATQPGLTVAAELTAAGTRVLVTAVYHPSQQLLAAAAGAQFIAPYVGRSTDAGFDGIELVREMAALSGPGFPRILAASLRGVEAVSHVAQAGAHDLTMSTAVARTLFSHELTGRAVAEFEDIAASSLARHEAASS
ncbi:transaldolase [Pseudactinotalea sp. HY160]|nr:transaldolase [Pseudactinotalea sp. HY160]